MEQARGASITPDVAFFVIRHGETSWNVEGRLQGQRDIPLSPIGQAQARTSGRRLARALRQRGVRDVDALRYVTSPLSRARETMQLLRSAMGVSSCNGYEVDGRLRELSFGAWEGLTWPEVKRLAPAAFRERKRDKWTFVPPAGESYAMLGDRLRPWLATIRNYDVVVAHGGVARVLMHLHAGVPSATVTDIDVWQDKVLVFERGRCRWA